MSVSLDEGLEVAVMLRSVGLKLQSNAARSLGRQALRVQKLARKMAPHDLGNLENAIKIEGVQNERDLDTGRFGRKEFIVYLDPDEPAEGRGGALVGQYLLWAHEYTHEPVPGSGPESVIKQSQQSEHVGPFFLYRAIDQVSDEIDNGSMQMEFELHV